MKKILSKISVRLSNLKMNLKNDNESRVLSIAVIVLQKIHLEEMSKKEMQEELSNTLLIIKLF
jgi:hypothetical protein